MSEPWFSFNFDRSQMPVMFGIAALIVLGLSERLLHILGLHQPKSAEREHLSFYLCTGTWQCAVLYSVLDAAYLHWTTLGPGFVVLAYVGMAVVIVGLVIRIAARVTLGRQFSGHVQTTGGHRLVTTGLYRLIRHPAYLGYLCLVLGFPLCFGSIVGLGLATMLALPALVYRIRIEETALAAWFGDEYRHYQDTTKRLIPWVW